MDYYNELYHYGVRGQKWGVRRYQNADGSLTPAGKKRARQEVKRDNATAYEVGRAATIYGHAAAKSMKRTIKIENKLDKQYAKDPDGVKRRTQALRKKWDASAKTTAELTESYSKLRDVAEKHCNSLIEKYGKEAVSGIKYTDKKLPKGEYSPSSFKTMNERTNNMDDYVRAGVATLAMSTVTRLMGTPFRVIYTPTTTGTKARGVETTMYRNNRKAQRS